MATYIFCFPIRFVLVCISCACISKMPYYNGDIDMTTTKRISINDLPDLLTLKEVSQVLRVSTLTLKRWGKSGKLPAIRINTRGDRRFKREEVLKILDGVQA